MITSSCNLLEGTTKVAKLHLCNIIAVANNDINDIMPDLSTEESGPTQYLQQPTEPNDANLPSEMTIIDNQTPPMIDDNTNDSFFNDIRAAADWAAAQTIENMNNAITTNDNTNNQSIQSTKLINIHGPAVLTVNNRHLIGLSYCSLRELP
jgi:hypothetical protein